GTTLEDPPTGDLELTGETSLLIGPNLVLQPYVPVHVYGDGVWVASTFSDSNGAYRLESLPEGTGLRYDIKACFVLDGETYFDVLADRLAPSNPWTVHLQLEEGPCS